MSKMSVKNSVFRRFLAAALAVTLCFGVGGFSVEAKSKAIVRGTYPTRRGQILVTTDKNAGPLKSGQVAIVWDKKHIIEVTSKGVVISKNNWNKKKKEVIGLDVIKTNKAQEKQAAAWCKQYVGKPYNSSYNDVDARDAFYGGQLVWSAYKELFGIDIADLPLTEDKFIKPLDIVTSDATKMVYYSYNKKKK